MDDETQPWQAKGHPVRISCNDTAMESMRQEAMAGLQKVPRRGLEIGGVLFGKRDGDTIKIEQWREIVCSHSRGPGFDLSEEDERQLEDQLANVHKDPEIARLEVVGWFRTRTKGGVFLSDGDLAFYDRFFPGPGDIVLVVRPQMYEPSRAGYFFRESDGVIRAQSSYNEFELENRRRRLPLSFDPARPPRRPRPPVEVPSEEPPDAAAAPPLQEPRPGGQSRLGFDPANPALGTDPVAPTLAPRAPRGSTAVKPDLEPDRKPQLSRRRKTVLAAVAVLVVLCVVVLGVPAIQGAREAALNLDARDISGQLVVDWNRTADALESATGGQMRIVDGAQEKVIDLSVDEVRGGTLVYQRRTGDVELHLTITHADGSSTSEIAKFVGSDPTTMAGIEAPATDSNPVLAGELERTRAELEQARNETDRVRTQVESEKRRLGVDPGR